MNEQIHINLEETEDILQNINNDDIIKISLKDGEVSSKVIKVGE